MEDNDNKDRHRIVMIITEGEKESLKTLSWRSGRSMGGYMRYLLNVDIGENSEYLSDS
jgi:hypothetical protein